MNFKDLLLQAKAGDDKAITVLNIQRLQRVLCEFLSLLPHNLPFSLGRS